MTPSAPRPVPLRHSLLVNSARSMASRSALDRRNTIKSLPLPCIFTNGVGVLISILHLINVGIGPVCHNSNDQINPVGYNPTSLRPSVHPCGSTVLPLFSHDFAGYGGDPTPEEQQPRAIQIRNS